MARKYTKQIMSIAKNACDRNDPLGQKEKQFRVDNYSTLMDAMPGVRGARILLI